MATLKNNAKVGNMASGSESCDLLLTSATPYISQKRLKQDSPARAVFAVHSMQQSPNLFGLLFIVLSKFIQTFISSVKFLNA